MQTLPRYTLSGVWAERPALPSVLQALEFKICKMRPSAQCLVCGERWSGGASRRFSSLVSGRTLLVKVFSVVHSVLHVDAYLPSGLQGTVSVRGILIGQGYAEPAEEPYESKVRAACGWSTCTRTRGRGAERGTGGPCLLSGSRGAEPDSDRCVEICGSFLNVFWFL